MIPLSIVPISTPQSVVFMHSSDAKRNSIGIRSPVRVQVSKAELYTVPVITDDLVKEGELGVPKWFLEENGLEQATTATVYLRKRPLSYDYVLKKARGDHWSKKTLTRSWLTLLTVCTRITS